MRFRLYLLQRLSALVMAPLVLLHLAVILWATRGGLSADEIVERYQGSWIWPMLYGLFVIAAAVHAPIGLRNIMEEWWPGRGRLTDGFAIALALLLLALGWRMIVALGRA